MPFRFRFTARSSSQAAFTRVELLIFAVVLLILAAVVYFPLNQYFERTSVGHALKSAATLNTLLAQYATDNDGVYPVGLDTPAPGKSEGIARNLLDNNYTPDATVFTVGSTPRYTGAAPDFSDLSPANISWDFTAGATTTTGLTTSAPDLLPILYTTGESVTYPTAPGTGLNLPLTGQGPFARQGMVVAYKDNHAAYILGTPSGSTVECLDFISKSYQGTAPYTQIKP